jgi:predicted phosphate transport protein (TIGR00153 family)
MAVGARGCSHPPHALASRAVRLAFTPKTTEFYDLFSRAGENVLAVAQLSERRFAQIPDSDVRQREIKQLEHEGDRITREIVELLNTQYITPFDREDIYALAAAIDDVVDHIDEASELLGVYKVEAPSPKAVRQCELLVAGAELLSQALTDLKTLKNASQHVVDVKQIEDDGDVVLREAIAELFEQDDAKTIIKWKDIHDALEEAIDACEEAANVIGNVVLKNA